ncbi:MAG: inositol 2-dehydrogenase [Thermoproteales archaeon]|nr:inositol 2-dehydrogenase [Thermoproteales archaeon]RLE64319.1 MAG: inositol 2-dehydrogenase [Thermoprotei archaeon]
MYEIGVGVVGLGRIGKIHAEIFAYKVENARLVAVMDIVENLAKNVAEKFKAKWYNDYQKLLSDPEIDAVAIVTPTFLHKEMIVQAAEAGKHIFVEKPLTVTVDEAQTALQAVRKAGVKMQVGYMRRFDYAYKNAKKKIEKGEIGKPLVFVGIARDPGAPPGWAAEPSKSGGIFLDMLSHDFDMARWLMSAEVKEVYVQGGAYLYDEIKRKGDLDVVTINFRFDNGAIGLIHGSRKSVFGYDLRTEVMGTEGTLYIGTLQDHMFAHGRGDGLVYGGVQWFWKRFYDAYVEEDQSFINAVKKDEEPLVAGIDGLRAVEIAEACWKSYREKKPVEIPLG